MNLIAFDLVIVQPMSSISGFINYISYVAGSNKGTTKQGDVFNNPFKLGDVDANYTSERVVETFTATASQTEYTVAWSPVSDRKVDGVYADVKAFINGTATTVADVDSKSGKITITGTVAASDTIKIAYV